MIEFAFCVSVFITLIFYAHDLFVMKRTQSQMNFMAEIMVNVIQNISQNRDDKIITKKDLNYARCAAGLTYYGGKNHYPVKLVYPVSNSWLPTGGNLCFYIYYIKGIGDNKCQILWGFDAGHMYDRPNSYQSSTMTGDNSWSVVYYRKGECDSSSIYKSLEIEKDQYKAILDLWIWQDEGCAKMSDGTSIKEIPVPRRFGMYLISPKRCRNNAGGQSYFHSVVIFTPKPGLFSETPPR